MSSSATGSTALGSKIQRNSESKLGAAREGGRGRFVEVYRSVRGHAEGLKMDRGYGRMTLSIGGPQTVPLMWPYCTCFNKRKNNTLKS